MEKSIVVNIQSLIGKVVILDPNKAEPFKELLTRALLDVVNDISIKEEEEDSEDKVLKELKSTLNTLNSLIVRAEIMGLRIELENDVVSAPGSRWYKSIISKTTRI